MIRSVAVVDTFERDGRVLLLLPNQLIEPGPLAALVLSLSTEGISMADLVNGVVEVIGVPASGTAADHVATCVTDLCQVGLLTLDEDGT